MGYMVATVFIRMQAFLLIPFVTRFVPKDDLSVFETLLTYATVVGMFSVLGLDGALATLYRHPDYEKNRRAMGGTVVLLVGAVSLLAGAGLMLFTGHIEQTVFHGRWDLGVEMAMASAGVMAGSLQHVLANILRQEFEVRKFNISVIGGGLLSFVATLVVVIWLECGIRGMLAVVLATGLLKLGLMLWWTRPYLNFSFQLSLTKRLLSLGLPLLPLSVCGWLMSGFDRTLLQMWRSSGEVMDYAMANKFSMLATVVTSAFQTAWWPYAMNRAREPGIGQHFQQVCRVACVCGALLAAAVAVVTPVVMWVLFEPEYHQSFRTTGLQVLANVINTYYYFPLVSLLVMMKIKTEVLGYLAGMAVTVLLDIALVKPLGAAGAALASVFGYLVLAAIVGRLGRKFVDFGFPLGRTEVFLAGSAAALSVWVWLPATHYLHLLLNGAISFACIAAAGLLTGLLRREDAALFRLAVLKAMSRFIRRRATT